MMLPATGHYSTIAVRNLSDPEHCCLCSKLFALEFRIHGYVISRHTKEVRDNKLHRKRSRSRRTWPETKMTTQAGRGGE